MGADSNVIHPTDAAIDSPAVSACTIVPQAGCSGSTPACDIHDDGSTYCRGVTSQGTSNNHCAADTECKDGYTCIDDGTTGHTAWCSRFCTQDSQCTGTGSRCVDDLIDGNGNPLDVTVCSNACEPNAQTGCPSAMGCLPFESANGDFTDCTYMGTKGIGQSCVGHEDCSAGSLCVNNNSVKTCKKICIVGASSTCTTGTCTGFVDPLSIGANTYGACN